MQGLPPASQADVKPAREPRAWAIVFLHWRLAKPDGNYTRHVLAIARTMSAWQYGATSALGGPVVPERDRAGLPFEAAMKFRRLDVTAEHLQQRVALVPFELRDASREATIDEQQLAASHRVGAHKVYGSYKLKNPRRTYSGCE